MIGGRKLRLAVQRDGEEASSSASSQCATYESRSKPAEHGASVALGSETALQALLRLTSLRLQAISPMIQPQGWFEPKARALPPLFGAFCQGAPTLPMAHDSGSLEELARLRGHQPMARRCEPDAVCQTSPLASVAVARSIDYGAFGLDANGCDVALAKGAPGPLASEPSPVLDASGRVSVCVFVTATPCSNRWHSARDGIVLPQAGLSHSVVVRVALDVDPNGWAALHCAGRGCEVARCEAESVDAKARATGVAAQSCTRTLLSLCVRFRAPSIGEVPECTVSMELMIALDPAPSSCDEPVTAWPTVLPPMLVAF